MRQVTHGHRDWDGRKLSRRRLTKKSFDEHWDDRASRLKVLATVPKESRKRKPRKENLKILQEIWTFSRQRIQGKRQRFEKESPESRPKPH